MGPTCTDCGHEHACHTRGEKKKCRMKKVKGWDSAAMKFKEEECCTCEGYAGRQPTSKEACPHDFITGSRVCLYCTKVVQKQKVLKKK